MSAWRICRKPFADLSGEGARLYGGRWNSPGHPLLYTAETAALAVLEVRVHLDLAWDVLPDDYVLVEIELGRASVEMVPEIPADSASFGDAWLAERRSALLKVPSTIIAECFNILINPAHSDAGAISVTSMREFRFDERLWRPAP